MSTYRPDSWKLVKLVSPEHGTIYKVLASWYGGFAGSDHWKLSSGIEGVSVEDKIITLPQSSGSVYELHENNEHISSLIGSVYASFVKDLEDAGGPYTIEMVTLDEVMNAFKGQA